MAKKSLIPPILLSLGMATALLWLLPLRQDPVGAALPPPPTPTPPAVTRHVAVSGTDAGNDCAAPSEPCRTVQHAVDTARGGDPIKVAQGTYSDTHQRNEANQLAYIDKSLTLQGGYTTTNCFAEPPQPEAHPTTLDARGQGRVIVIDRAGPTVEGFTITGGAGYYSGGGIYVVGGWGVTLRHNRIVENAAEGDGGAIFFSGGSGQIVDNLIACNTGTWSAGLRIINNADVAVLGNEIRGNTAQIKAGGIDIDCCGGTTPFIARNLIIDNDGGGGGGGISVMSTNARLVNNIVALNRADRGAGILLEGSPSLPVSVTLVHNTLVGHGGGDEGVRAEGQGAATLTNNIVASCTTGIANTAPASATVSADHTLFDGNGADYGPGVSSTNALSGSAAFISPGAGDYHITAASAAEGAGVQAGVRVDFDNDLRLGALDIGADEYWAPGLPKRFYLPGVSVSPYPLQPPQIEPQTGQRFPCEGDESGHCINGFSDRRLLDVSIAYDVQDQDICWYHWGCTLYAGDPVIIVRGEIENGSGEDYWTILSCTAYDGSGHLIGRSVSMSPFEIGGKPLFLPAQGTSGFTLYLKSSRFIELIRIEAEGALSEPPPPPP